MIIKQPSLCEGLIFFLNYNLFSNIVLFFIGWQLLILFPLWHFKKEVYAVYESGFIMALIICSRTGFVRYLKTRPGYTGRGYATSLINYCHGTMCRPMPQARQFFSSNGFTKQRGWLYAKTKD